MEAILNKDFETRIKDSAAKPEQFHGNFHVVVSTPCEYNSVSAEDYLFLDRLYSLIEENLDNQNFNLSDLIKALFVNRTYFFQKVKMLTDQTPFTLLKTYRLKRATQILAQKKLPVNEVYVMVGFKSRTHFTKAFKETYQISPSRYATEIRNNKNIVSHNIINLPFEILN